MAYDFNNLQNVGTPLAQTSATVWSYTSHSDNLVTIETSGYFAVGSNTDDNTSLIKKGDFILVSATDGNAILVVSSINPVVTSIMNATPAFKGSVIWSGSGATLESTIAGIGDSNNVQATITTAPTQAAYLVSAAPTTNTITFTLSAANTSNNAVISYVVF